MKNQLRPWYEMWEIGAASTRDFAFAAEHHIATTRDVTGWTELPLSVRDAILRDADRFFEEGRELISPSGSGRLFDISDRMRDLLVTLQTAGLWQAPDGDTSS